VNEWLTIVLVTVFFALFALFVVAAVFGIWIGVRKLTHWVSGSLPSRAQRS
jgi:hypothetical protein